MATLPHAATQLGSSISTSQTNHLHQPNLFSHQTPWYPTQFPVQSTLHPNHNKAVQYAYSAELQNVPTFPSCSTSSTPLQKGCALLQKIHTRPEHVLNLSFTDGVSSSPHKQVDKNNKTHVIFDEERTLEQKIEASFTSLNMNLLCIKED